MNAAVTLGILILNSIWDIRKREIFLFPTIVVLAAGILWQIVYRQESIAVILFSFFPGLLLLTASLLTKGKLGVGDALAALAVGAWNGAIHTTTALLFSFVISLISAAILWISGKEKHTLPFIPFFLGGYLITLLSA
ncbi:MAG: prepilin peptidase [Eubacterium sp.]|nr:prepilin peptidase [Eubacterium sp.]